MNALANDLSTLSRSSRAYLNRVHQHFINGRFVSATTDERIAVVDPTR